MTTFELRVALKTILPGVVLLPAVSLAGVEQRGWDLYQGNTVVGRDYADEQACIKSAQDRAPGAYECRKSTRIVVPRKTARDSQPRTHPNIIFSDDFDAHPDWVIGRGLPRGYVFAYQEKQGANPSLRISSDPEHQYPGSKKSLVAYYKTSRQYEADGWLGVDIEPTAKLYVGFAIRFQDGFNDERSNGSVKLMRALHYDGTGSRASFFPTGNSAPIYLFDWARTDYGVRHKHAFRANPQKSQYYMDREDIRGNIRAINRGDMSSNFTSDIAPLGAALPDLRNGGRLPSNGVVEHDQVYGNRWHKMEFYLQLNSAPGVRDGQFKFWLDGTALVDLEELAWIQQGGDMNALWNHVALGGNGKINWRGKEKWVAFDNLVIGNINPRKANR